MLYSDSTLTHTKASLRAKKEEENLKGDLTTNLIHFPTQLLGKKYRVKKHLEAVFLSLKFIL